MWVPLLAVVAMLLVVGRWVSASVVAHAWFAAMGVPALFWEQVVDAVLLQGGAWVLGSLFAFANLHAVRRTILAVAMPVRVGNLELTAMVPGRRLTIATAVLAMIVAALLSLPLTNWNVLAMARHGVPFGEIEGITGRDLGFFVYWLPFEETLYLWALVLLVTVTAMVLVLYALTRSLRVQGRRLAVSTHVRRHVSVLGALVLVLLAWSYRLDAYDLLSHGSGPDGLFLRVDHHVTLRADLLLAVLCALAAPIVLRTGWMGQLRAAILTLSLVFAAAVLLRHVGPAIASRSDVLGHAPARDRDYLASRATFSRRAFDVDALSADTLSMDAARPPRDPWETVRSASLYPLEAIRTGSAGEPRTTPGAGSSPLAGWWIHPDGLRALVIQRSTDGLQDWSVSSTSVGTIEPEAREEPMRPHREASRPWPLVAPGLSSSVVLSAADAGDAAVVPLESPGARLAHAWAMRDPSILRVHQERERPGIVTRRDVRDRIQRLLPVMVVGREVSPVMVAERVVWSVPLYAASDRYPLSQRWAVADGVYGYFRLAGVAFVDAQTGRVRILPIHKPDPIMRTWMQRIPQLIATESEIGASVIAQVPPAFERVFVQLHTFARYGSREAMRRGAAIGRRLPEGILVGGHMPAPYLDRADTVAGRGALRWAVPLVNGADQVDGVVEAYGGRAPGARWIPLRPPHARWRAMLPDSTWSPRAGGTGRDDRPLANQATDSRLPSLIPVASGVVVWQRAMNGSAANRGATIRATWTDSGTVQRAAGNRWSALVAAFGGGAARDDVERSIDREASTPPLVWYTRMRSALQRGDWTAFGTAFDSLGEALRRKDTGGTPPP